MFLNFKNFPIFVVGGRYKIYMEEREGFVDSSLIIGNIVSQDHMSRYNTEIYRTPSVNYPDTSGTSAAEETPWELRRSLSQ